MPILRIKIVNLISVCMAQYGCLPDYLAIAINQIKI
jgi:hypothetical protein